MVIAFLRAELVQQLTQIAWMQCVRPPIPLPLVAGLATTDIDQNATTSVLMLMALIVVSINRRLIAAIRDPRPERVQSGVGILLLSLVMIVKQTFLRSGKNTLGYTLKKF